MKLNLRPYWNICVIQIFDKIQRKCIFLTSYLSFRKILFYRQKWKGYFCLRVWKLHNRENRKTWKLIIFSRHYFVCGGWWAKGLLSPLMTSRRFRDFLTPSPLCNTKMDCFIYNFIQVVTSYPLLAWRLLWTAPN